MRLRLLRALLLFSAFAWGVSCFGVILPWANAVEALQGLGAKEIPADPMLDYWLRMASGAFALVGGLFLLLALQPVRYAVIIPWFGWLMIAEGIILLFHGVRLHLPPLPFYADTTACFLGGFGIVACAGAAQPDRH
jgi:FtsH-binding integral membrane protein